jgi:hypothetical protein
MGRPMKNLGLSHQNAGVILFLYVFMCFYMVLSSEMERLIKDKAFFSGLPGLPDRLMVVKQN